VGAYNLAEQLNGNGMGDMGWNDDLPEIRKGLNLDK
jgi:hypothetical protein